MGKHLLVKVVESPGECKVYTCDEEETRWIFDPSEGEYYELHAVINNAYAMVNFPLDLSKVRYKRKKSKKRKRKNKTKTKHDERSIEPPPKYHLFVIHQEYAQLQHVLKSEYKKE